MGSAQSARGIQVAGDGRPVQEDPGPAGHFEEAAHGFGAVISIAAAAAAVIVFKRGRRQRMIFQTESPNVQQRARIRGIQTRDTFNEL